MAIRSFKRFVEKELGNIPHFCVYAVLELVLIAILFVDGFISFFANEFAKLFELKVPCLLCTRIDHALVGRHTDFYYNESICDSHKKHVSSLAYCHVHKKLSEIRKMCEHCLLSFATERETDCDTYKSLIGILHKDLELLVDDDEDIQIGFPAGKKEELLIQQRNVESFNVNQLCMCCGEPLKTNSQAKPMGMGSGMGMGMGVGSGMGSLSLAPAPSPRAFNQRGSDLPHLQHVKYSELKFPQGELEDDDGSNVPSRFREEIKSTGVPLLNDLDENEDKTPNFIRGGNRFFGIPLSDSAQNSPRWTTRSLTQKSMLARTENAPDSTDQQLLPPDAQDGESILHHLKRQVRLDRKSLMALYMELDEERSASAVAANNAMAMITRLQAEKAALHMEALQYQRMMEEQAEYDEEALQATHDILTKREEEMKDLETELEAYREKYGVLSQFGSQGEILDEEFEEFKLHSQSFDFAGEDDLIGPVDSSSEGSNRDNDENQKVVNKDIVEKPKGDKDQMLSSVEKPKGDRDQILSSKGSKDDDESEKVVNNASVEKPVEKPKGRRDRMRSLGRMKNLDKKHHKSSSNAAGSSSASSSENGKDTEEAEFHDA